MGLGDVRPSALQAKSSVRDICWQSNVLDKLPPCMAVGLLTDFDYEDPLVAKNIQVPWELKWDKLEKRRNIYLRSRSTMPFLMLPR